MSRKGISIYKNLCNKNQSGNLSVDCTGLVIDRYVGHFLR